MTSRKPWGAPQLASPEPPVGAYTIGSINRLPLDEKRIIYARAIPEALFEKCAIPAGMFDSAGRDLMHLHCPPGSASAEIMLYHEYGFPDPVLQGHITDTINGQIYILFYQLNNPFSPRFDIDRMPDGRPTLLGTCCRNLDAEIAAFKAGLAPGQIRSGLHLLRDAMRTFEAFVAGLGHNLHFAEPLFYHNAVIFERYGFAYQRGRRLMERIQRGFSPGGEFLPLLDGRTPFRQPEAANSIRLRSWAIHDGILGEPFRNVTMYKQVGVDAKVSTCPDIAW
ncbi:MAG TPA: hypothetical protein EYP88_08875 [Anaerolineales bacterium]|nr:hypothetical protein [Anaerolineales bacterium]